MKPKTFARLAVDLAMALLLPCLMAYLLVGETAHEWLGAGMFGLFALHHALNAHWHGSLFKGRYTLLRTVQALLDALLLAAMLSLTLSGMALSRVVFRFIPIAGGTGFARTLHMLASYWGFVLMSLHLGTHWGVVLAAIRSGFGLQGACPARAWALRGLTALLCTVGLYAFAKNGIASYLFCRARFVFFDPGQPLALFFAEYLGMMCLFAVLGHWAARLLARRPGPKGRPHNGMGI